MEVPNPPGYRVNFALQTEQRIHKTLKDLGKSTGEKTKEWFKDLSVIRMMGRSTTLAKKRGKK
jgi:hypothetical protein